MRGRAVIWFLPTLLGVLTCVASADARDRASDGAVRVRGVQVREVQVRGEVRVDQPTPHPQRNQRQSDQRPDPDVNRPRDSGVISRSPSQRQPLAAPPRPTSRDGAWRRDRDSSRRRGDTRYYAFRPRFNAGYGVVVGYPVIYPYAYPYQVDPFSPIAAPGVVYVPGPNRNTYTTYSNVNTYSNVDSITSSTSAGAVAPVACEDAAPCGGLSFEINPATAQVWVDGVLTGVVDDFTATGAPLLLAPGDHYVELRLAGYRTASFDVTITAGEVTPYQGTLELLRLRTP